MKRLVPAVVPVVALIVSLSNSALAGPRPSSSLAEALKLSAAAAESGLVLDCPVIITDGVVTVAPDQPPVASRATVGIVNALCDVTLDIVGCGFSPTSVSINCDTNADGVPDLTISLKNVTQVNNLLTRATLLPILPQLPGTGFPLACCGGSATITLSRTVSAGDDNIFGPFTQSQTCPIDLGIRAPVVVSASPVDGDCTQAQDLIIPGSCFVLPGGIPNVTSVFAVERGNTSNVIQSTRFVILNGNLIDALFNFGPSSSGKTFLIFASGPNGTSRNMVALPAGAPADCPIGNEQGIQVTFMCKSSSAGGSPPDPAVNLPTITSCQVNRNSSGSFTLTLFSNGVTGIEQGSEITVGGIRPKKIQFKDPITSDRFSRVVLKGKFCGGLPGPIVVTSPSGVVSSPFLCSSTCE